MPDMVHMQFTQSNAYLTQLLEQFTRIEKRIEGGETVTLNLTEGDRAISLIVSRDHVVEGALPVVRLPTAKPQTLVDNDSLIAGITKTFNFDLGEATRNIAPAEIHRHITKGLQEKNGRWLRAPCYIRFRVTSPAVTYDGSEWIRADDCAYRALDGFTVKVKHGFKTDLASISRLLWACIASFELSLVAPIVHDLIYGSGGRVALPNGEISPAEKIFVRKEADDLFLELMTRAKVSSWKRNVAYLAVRGFGGSSWKQG